MRKHSIQHVDLTGDLIDFNFVAKVDPASSSFYLSTGISILEALIRLKTCPELTHQTWVNIFESLKKTRSTAESWLLLEKHQEFKKIVETLNNSERKHAVKYMKTILNNSNFLLAIDYGMRFIVQLVAKTDIEFILNGSFKDFLAICMDLACLLNIGIGVARGTQLKYFVSNLSPMIFLFISQKDQFCILYHKACKYLDEKFDFNYTDCSVYPFTSSGIRIKEDKNKKKIGDKGNDDDFVAFVEVLSKNLKKNLNDTVKAEILKKAEKVSINFPRIYNLKAFDDIRKSLNASNNNESGYSFDSGSPGIRTKTRYAASSLARNKTFSNAKRRIKNESLEYYSNLCRNNIELYKICKYCKKVINCSDFSLINCDTHTICIQCRTGFYVKGIYSCPECERSYSIREHNLLKVNDTSKKNKTMIPRYS